MERVICFIDGFNLYHAIKRLRKPHLKWINLWTLSECFIGSRSQELKDVLYFSAYAYWLPGPVARHRAYVSAVRANGVTAILGRFKEKDHRCPVCRHSWKGHEEKETDVNLALALLNLARLEEYDRAFVVSRDSDLAPAIRLCREAFPEKKFTVIAPPHLGHSTELTSAAQDKAKITMSHLERCVMPEIVTDAGGNAVAWRPPKYRPPPN